MVCWASHCPVSTNQTRLHLVSVVKETVPVVVQMFWTLPHTFDLTVPNLLSVFSRVCYFLFWFWCQLVQEAFLSPPHYSMISCYHGDYHHTSLAEMKQKHKTKSCWFISSDTFITHRSTGPDCSLLLPWWLWHSQLLASQYCYHSNHGTLVTMTTATMDSFLSM